MPRSTAIALLLAVVLAGCSGGDRGGETASEIPGGADAGEVEVIDEWAKTLSEGDVDAAAGFFAIPSVAENGPTLQIENLDDAKLFNSSLPCGAVLVEATPDDGFTIATFRLTERPGAGVCGAGTGAEAQTAFRIEEGKITEWRRVIPGHEPGGDAAPAPSSSA